MKRLLVVNENGRILASVPHPVSPSHEGGPDSVAIVPLAGQRVCVVDLPAELEGRDGLARLHRDYHVRGGQAEPRLERTDGG